MSSIDQLKELIADKLAKILPVDSYIGIKDNLDTFIYDSNGNEIINPKQTGQIVSNDKDEAFFKIVIKKSNPHHNEMKKILYRKKQPILMSHGRKKIVKDKIIEKFVEIDLEVPIVNKIYKKRDVEVIVPSKSHQLIESALIDSENLSILFPYHQPTEEQYIDFLKSIIVNLPRSYLKPYYGVSSQETEYYIANDDILNQKIYFFYLDKTDFEPKKIKKVNVNDNYLVYKTEFNTYNLYYGAFFTHHNGKLTIRNLVNFSTSKNRKYFIL